MRKLLVLLALTVTSLGVLASTVSAEPGVSPRTITVGGTFPLSGPASGYAPIPNAMKAYFSFINARKGPDGKRGVFGRQIVFKIYDDQFNPAQTVQLTRRLVEQDKVFAVVGALGTEPNLAIRPYLNSKKVPQILNATGASTWGRDAKRFPWTGGWQPDYVLEGKLYGQAIARNSPNAKIAVLLQNDDYGADYLDGLEQGLGDGRANIVAKESYELTAADVRSQIAKLRASGASIFVIFATPKFTIQSYVFAKALGWNPPVIYTNSVSATDTFLTLAQKSGAGALVNNTFSVQYSKDPANPKWDADSAMKLYRQVMAQYYPSGRVTDALNLYGVAVAHAFVQLLTKAGPNPTRASLMQAYRNWNETNPFLLPGNRQKTKGVDQFPVGCEQLVKFTDGTFQPVSQVRCG